MSPVLEEAQNRVLNVAISKKEKEAAEKHFTSDDRVKIANKVKDNKEDAENRSLVKTPPKKDSKDKKEDAKDEAMEVSAKDLAEAGGSSSSSGIKSFFKPTTKEERMKKEAKENAKAKEEKEAKEAQEKEEDKKDQEDEAASMEEDEPSEGKAKSKKRPSEGGAQSGAKRTKKEKEPPKEVCKDCLVALDHPSLRFYEGHPEGSVPEVEALFNPIIMGEGMGGDEEKPEHKLTDFIFYDEAGHIVRFDNGIIDNGGHLYVSGYMKPIYEDSVVCENGMSVQHVGQVLEWWVAGAGDSSEKHIVGITTDMAYYYLMAPHKNYEEQMSEIDSKLFIGKCVIDLLSSNQTLDTNDMEYEDLMHHLEEIRVPEGIDTITEDAVIKHADSIVGLVLSYEEAADDDEEVFMMDSPAMKNLMALAGVNKKKKALTIVKRGPSEPSKKSKMKKAEFTKATTTPLVRLVMESFFKNQMAGVSADDKSNKENNAVSKEEDEDEPASGDEDAKPTSTSKRRGVKDEEEEEKPLEVYSAKMKKKMNQLKNDARPSLHWDGEPLLEQSERSYYSGVIVDDDRYEVGDFTYLYMESSRLRLRRIEYMYEDSDGELMAHVQHFEKGCYTLLGELAEPKEAFQMGMCDDVHIANFVGKAKVTWWPTPKNWFEMGGTDDAALQMPPINPDDEHEFFYRMRYVEESGRFEHGFKVSKKEERPRPDFCKACPFREAKEKRNILRCVNLEFDKCDASGRYSWRTLECYGETLKLNDACFILPPSSMSGGGAGHGRNKVDESAQEKIKGKKEAVNQDKYPEYYRKSTYIRGSNRQTAKPFSLGIIENIHSVDQEGKKKVRVTIRKLYRPEETSMAESKALQKDFNLVYWSEDVVSIDASHIKGKCYVRPECGINGDVLEWTKEGERRFYYKQIYNKNDKSFDDLTSKAERYCRSGNTKGKGNGKGKGKSSSSSPEPPKENVDDGALPHISRSKLRTLDVFAGCGGLSCGLHESGVVESKWAIEVFEPAAVAYKANNPDCTVFTDCCNLLLEKVMNGEATNDKKQVLPRKGEVDLLCGGPPCQGFSGMNRFNHREYSAFKNSLIASYLSYAEYYRPKFFILENVRNFASFKKAAVLKLCMKALLKMGYSCSFGILQAGNYGVAQTRRRAILLAAAPGEQLPFYPEPTNVFAKTPLSVSINNKIYSSNVRWTESAPYRTVTVRDVMSDLPEIESGHKIESINYKDVANTQFQRKMRAKSFELTEHICKQMSAIVDKRMELIPTGPGSDWRDLPNIITKLRDGTLSDKLVYNYHDYREGRGRNGALRGVCACALKKGAQCDPADKQANTLIPWCLPHTSARHNQWAGLYGRLEYDGYFSTTVTNPEPMGKQGRVLHPEQHRLVSVRECARSQGFPDWYRFQGTILEKHRQVGNAVPPPMGLALGVEIRKAMMAKDQPEDKKEAEVKEEADVKEDSEDKKE